MAQEASGLPYRGGNTSGVGAVYFDNNFAAQGESIANRLTTAVQNKREADAAKQKIALGLIGDMNLDTKGIMDTDAPYFKQQAANLQGMYADVLRSAHKPNSPEYIDAVTKLKGEQNRLMTEVNQSRGQKEMLVSSMSNYDPKKHDDMSLVNSGKFRLADPVTRSQYDVSKLLIPKKEDFGDLMTDYLKTIKPSASAEEVTLPSGQTAIETSVAYTPEQVGSIASAVMYDELKRESAERSFSRLTPDEQEAYITRAGNGDPLKLFVKDWVQNQYPSEKKLRGSKYSPMQSAYAKLWGDREKENEDVDYLVERFSQVATSDDTFSAEQPLNKVQKTVAAAFAGTDNPTIRTSGVLSGLNLGDTNIPKYDGDKLTGYEPIKNRHLYFAKIGDKLFAVTSKSQALAMQGGDLYIPVNEDYLDDLTSGSSNPIKTKEQLKKSLISKGLYADGRIQILKGEPVKIDLRKKYNY